MKIIDKTNDKTMLMYRKGSGSLFRALQNKSGANKTKNISLQDQGYKSRWDIDAKGFSKKGQKKRQNYLV